MQHVKKLIQPFFRHPEVSSGIVLVCVSVIARLMPHPANLAPIGAVALFAGAHYSKRVAFLIPLAALFISDLFLGFYSAITYTYIAFALVTVMGFWLKKQSPAKLLSASLFASVLFFLVSNFGMWITGTWFPHTFSGLMKEYVLGLPFFRNTLIGDQIYTFTFFYGYRFVSSLHTKYAKSV